MTSARDLSAHLAELLHRERAALAEFLVALADFDRKRLWIELGQSGRPGGLLPRGSHGSGRADFPHPALQPTVSLRGTRSAPHEVA